MFEKFLKSLVNEARDGSSAATCFDSIRVYDEIFYFIEWQTPAKKSKRRSNDESGDENDESDAENVGDDDDDADEDDDESPDIDMHWNLASYLPEAGACRKNLYTVIIGEWWLIDSQ